MTCHPGATISFLARLTGRTPGLCDPADGGGDAQPWAELHKNGNNSRTQSNGGLGTACLLRLSVAGLPLNWNRLVTGDPAIGVVVFDKHGAVWGGLVNGYRGAGRPVVVVCHRVD
jgi:hypothetical protein